MSLKEIICILENDKNKLQKENAELKRNNYELTKKVRELGWEIRKMTVKMNSLKKASNVVVDKPAIEEVGSQLTTVVANEDGETYADVVEEPKPKRSRRKKTEEAPIFVEPVEESENV